MLITFSALSIGFKEEPAAFIFAVIALDEATKLLKRLEAQGSELAPVSQQLDLFAEPVDSSDEEEQIQNDKPAMTDAEQDVLDDISNLYLADKTPLQIMQMVADWQKDLKDDN